jgi:hypothetical protein
MACVGALCALPVRLRLSCCWRTSVGWLNMPVLFCRVSANAAYDRGLRQSTYKLTRSVLHFFQLHVLILYSIEDI